MRLKGCTLLLSALLFGCASNEKETAQRQRKIETVQKVDSTLRPGMTYDEIKNLGLELSNCSGNPKKPVSCEANFNLSSKATNSTIYVPDSLNYVDGDMSNSGKIYNKSLSYTLYFGPDGKLTRYQRKEELR